MTNIAQLLPRRAVTGIDPFNELNIDAQIWREAHDQHHLHRSLHAAVAHRPGIVSGLDVIASPSKTGGILVAPGVGIDTRGQTIVLAEPVSFTLEERGQIYITLGFLRTHDRASATQVGGGQQYYRLVEGRDLKATKEPGDGPFIELARIYRTGTSAPVQDARNPFDPGNDELNLLMRPTSFPHCYADLTLGEVPYVPRTDASRWKPNRAGLVHLVREGGSFGFHLEFAGPVNLRAQPKAPLSLLYIAGQDGFQPLAPEEVSGLRAFLDGGGILLGEGTVEDTEGQFASGFRQLAEQLGGTLAPVADTHPLCTAHHVFPAPPPGAQTGTPQFLGDDLQGIYWSTYDWGGAWQGRVSDGSAQDKRGRVRAALEWGLNLAAYAARRKYRNELSRLG